MKKLIAIALAILVILTMTAALAEDDRTVTMTGSATVKVPADRAQIYLGVVTRAETAGEASQENARLMDTLIQALLDEGIRKEAITTQNYSVYSVYDYSSANPEVTGYEVNNWLNITIDDISTIGKVIDVGLANGANSCNGLNFFSSQEKDAQDEALVGAIEEGRRRAEIAAKAGGYTLGDLVSIEETYSTYGGIVNALASTDKGTSTSIFANNLEYTANVTITFELR